MANSSNKSKSFHLRPNGHGLIFFHPILEEIVTKYLPKLPTDQIPSSGLLAQGITIISASESENEETLQNYFCENPTSEEDSLKLIDLGLGLNADEFPVHYIVIHFPEGDKIRKYFKLKNQIHFHVKLADHFLPKSNLLSLLIEKNNPGEFLTQFPSPIRAKQIEYLEWTLENFPKNPKLIIELSKLYPRSEVGAQKVLKLSEQLLKLNDLAGFYLKIKILKFNGDSNAISIFRQISNTLFSFKISENQDQEDFYVNFLLKFLNEECNEGETKYYFYEFNPSSRQFEKYQMPRNFGWVRPGLTAGCSVPDLKDLEIFVKMGIKHVITCLERPLQIPKHNLDIQIHYFDIEDRTPPTFEQLDKMLEIFSRGEPTLVHCKGGVGRTNTVLACDLIQTEKLNSQEAVTKIKALRPKVILHDSQVKFIREFSNRKYCLQAQAAVELPKVLMFCGYPASGKSTVSQHICAVLGEDQVVRINQDEMGKKNCIEEFNNHLKSDKMIIIDCCNLTKEKRGEWMAMGFHSTPTWCVFMDLPIEECKYRIVRRLNHPTAKLGGRVLDRLENVLEPPEEGSNSEEGFEKVIYVQTDADIGKLLKDLGIGQPLVVPENTNGVENIIKFPRTRHLVNLGSATRDDLLLSPGEQHEFSNHMLQVEEKIDGANLGILVRKDYKIQVQNRSHFVSSSYHAQFKLLDKWVFKHTDELIQILEPEKEILYGEWMYMKHSIHYTRLPDYFIAFDLYNIHTRTFLSRDELTRRLENTTICQVPLIAHRKFANCDEIVDLLKTKSAFYDGPIEGVYLRICDDTTTTTLDRAKVVRQDFICGAGNENVRHWTKHQLTINILRH